MDIEKSFRYPFDDQQWSSKLGLGAVISMVPILNFAWSGYMVAVLRNVMNNVSEPLPNWDDLGKKFTDGLILFAASLVYMSPVLIAICLPMSIMVVPAILSGNQDLQGISDAIAGAGGVLFLCLLCVFLVYGLAMSILYPAIMVLFAREGTFASCFKLREAFDLISRNAAAFFTAWGISILASFVVSFAVGILQMVLNLIPCIGQLVSFVLTIGIVVYTSLVYAHLFGQFGAMTVGRSELAPVR